MQKYIFYSDPNHGWLRVTMKELEELGIANKISNNSYMIWGVVFLEEDRDAELFIQAKKLPVDNYHIAYRIEVRPSMIRTYPRYSVPKREVEN